MIYFDLESHLGTLYKIEAITWENGKPKDKFFAVTNADMPDAVRRITGITHEQSLTGTDERETVVAFWNFLQRNQAVAAQKIVVNGKEYHKISCIGYGVSRELQKFSCDSGFASFSTTKSAATCMNTQKHIAIICR